MDAWGDASPGFAKTGVAIVDATPQHPAHIISPRVNPTCGETGRASRRDRRGEVEDVVVKEGDMTKANRIRQQRYTRCVDTWIQGLKD
jgi:hypothetical protein